MAEEKYVSGEEHQSMSKREKSSKKQVTIPIGMVGVVIVVIALCLISFIGGVSYQKNHQPKVTVSTTTGGGFGGGFGGAGARRSGGIGQVTAVSSTSITITNARSGASQTFTIDSNTVITDNGQTVAASDITSGDTVLIATSSSTSTTAVRINVNPSFGGGFSGGSSSSGSSAQTN